MRCLEAQNPFDHQNCLNLEPREFGDELESWLTSIVFCNKCHCSRNELELDKKEKELPEPYKFLHGQRMMLS